MKYSFMKRVFCDLSKSILSVFLSMFVESSTTFKTVLDHLRLHVRPILQMTGTGFFYLFFYMIPWNFEAFQAIWPIQLGSGSHLTLFISGQKLPVSQKGENWKNEIREIKGVRIVRIFSYFFWIVTIIVPIDSKNKIWTFLLKLGILEFFPFYQAWPI